MRFGAALLLTAILACAVGRGGEQPVEKDNPSVKYALLYTGSSVREGEKVLKDPNDKNTFWLAAARVYEQLLKRGYKPENIYFLYKDGKPDWSDAALGGIKEKLRKEFKSGYSNLATLENLRKVEKLIEKKCDANDTFLLYLTMHGKDGVLRSEHDRESMVGKDLTKLLKGNPTKKNLVFVHACYAENFIRNAEVAGIVIGASRTDTVAWGDRDFSFGVLYFKALNDKKSDADGDGSVSYREAFDAASKRYAECGRARLEYIKNRWAGKGVPDHLLKRLKFSTCYVDGVTRVQRLEMEDDAEIPRPKNLVPGKFDDVSCSPGTRKLLVSNSVGVCGYPIRGGELRFRPGNFARRYPDHGLRGFCAGKDGLAASLSWAKKSLIITGKDDKPVAYRLPGEITDPSGLAFDGESYLVADRKTKTVFKLKLDAEKKTATVAEKVASPGANLEGVTVHASKLWTTDGKLVCQFSGGVKKGSRVVRRYDLGAKVSGIAFAGKYLYATASDRGVIYSYLIPDEK
jgi:Peptidase C13 family